MQVLSLREERDIILDSLKPLNGYTLQDEI